MTETTTTTPPVAPVFPCPVCGKPCAYTPGNAARNEQGSTSCATCGPRTGVCYG